MSHRDPDTVPAWIVVAPRAALLAAPDPAGAPLLDVEPGTRLISVGEAVFFGGRLWRQVRHPTGTEGFIRDAFVVPETIGLS